MARGWLRLADAGLAGGGVVSEPSIKQSRSRDAIGSLSSSTRSRSARRTAVSVILVLSPGDRPTRRRSPRSSLVKEALQGLEESGLRRATLRRLHQSLLLCPREVFEKTLSECGKRFSILSDPRLGGTPALSRLAYQPARVPIVDVWSSNPAPPKPSASANARACCPSTRLWCNVWKRLSSPSTFELLSVRVKGVWFAGQC